jgi:transposase-like protein
LLSEKGEGHCCLGGDRWQVDETDVKVAGQWRSVYRAIDQFGQVIDVFVSRRWDITAARRFLARAIGVTKVMPVDHKRSGARLRPNFSVCLCQRPPTVTRRASPWRAGEPLAAEHLVDHIDQRPP